MFNEDFTALPSVLVDDVVMEAKNWTESNLKSKKLYPDNWRIFMSNAYGAVTLAERLISVFVPRESQDEYFQDLFDYWDKAKAEFEKVG